ncbi:TonB-dependent receptor domain-containing protein [Chryseobacterium sp. PTM-20240506]|uniref:TonB-dependent receptor domain-containing protein n=1 Tax=unclassified Chryseobacterium TaxID=2593645 RepID=UPI0023590601|nr:TonB-dependent receptor [Chryseobacterium sp. B21-037]MDC8104564.1 TonB-dependent receptor [Chryseobacterium sp. B21-037]
MKNVKLLHLLILLFPVLLYSQYKIEGRVLNKEKEPVKNAELLFKTTPSNNNRKVMTNDGGNFSIELIKGKYILTVKNSEYTSFEKEIIINSDTKLADIELVTVSKLIEEVKLTSSPKMITHKLDRTVFNVENNALANKGNIFETMKSVPGLVLKNDQISMLGRDAVKVMIDGRMINLSGDDLKNFLKSIPSENIKSVEVISNPSARYEAEGNSGIVNLVLKKTKKNSWNNNTTLTTDVAKTKYILQTVNNNFTYQKNKLSFLLNTGYSYGDTFTKQMSDIFFSDPYFLTTEQKWNYNQFSGRFLIDYDIMPKTKIGLQYLGGVYNNYVDDNVNTAVVNNANVPLYFLKGDGHIRDKNNNHSLNLHLEQKLDTLGKKLNIDLDYLSYVTDRNNTILSNQYNPDYSFEGINFFNRGISNQDINNYSLKFDIEHPGKFMNLNYGGKVGFTGTNYLLNNYDLTSNNTLTQSDQFKYDEAIQALYFNATKKFSDKWEGQIGLRTEYTQTKGHSVILDQTDYNKYLKLFPSVFIKNTINENNSLLLNYSRRIQRPSYGQLNPARSYINSQISSMGNPYLKPSYVDNIELSHTYKSLTSKLAFNVNSNAYNVFFKMNDETKEQIVTFDNYFKSYGYSLSETYEFNALAWWKSYVTLFLNYSQSKKTQDINLVLRNGFEFFGALNNSLTLNQSKTLTLDINYWYGSSSNQNLFHYSDANSLDMALSYKTPYKGLNLSIAAYDIFNSSPRTMLSEINGIAQTYKSFANNRFFRFSINYSFGNDKISKGERALGNESERERSR